MAILGFGKTKLNFTNRFLRYAIEAAFPFYILHQTVIVVIGYYAVQWDTGIAVKFIFINLAGLAGTVAIYEVAVRRIPPMRFLFGMKQRANPTR
jgi:hypothetical protein